MGFPCCGPQGGEVHADFTDSFGVEKAMVPHHKVSQGWGSPPHGRASQHRASHGLVALHRSCKSFITALKVLQTTNSSSNDCASFINIYKPSESTHAVPSLVLERLLRGACMAAAGCPRLVPAPGRACNIPGAHRVLINVYGFMFNSWIKSPKYGI